MKDIVDEAHVTIPCVSDSDLEPIRRDFFEFPDSADDWKDEIYGVRLLGILRGGVHRKERLGRSIRNKRLGCNIVVTLGRSLN